MKLFKKLLSRTTLVLFILLLQLILLAVIFSRLVNLYIYFTIPVTAISVLFVLIVINRDMSASYKVPWIIVLLAIPVMGIVLYLTLGYPRMNSKQRKTFENVYEKTSKICDKNDYAMDCLKSEDALCAGQAEYLRVATGMPVYQNTETKYFTSGEEAFEVLKERLKAAKKFIYMEYFIIEEGKMWNPILEILEAKVGEGVDVKVMYDDFGCSGKIKHDYDKTLRSKGIDCVKFGKLTPVLTAVHNNRDHRKITVIDGEEAFTGGYNLCDEYINETSPFGYWKDTGVYLRGEAVKSFTLMFLRQFAVQSGREMDYETPLSLGTSVQAAGYCLPFGDGPAPLYKDNIGEEAYLNMINQAKRYVYITTPYLIVDYHFMKALKLAAKRGVDVRIITPYIPDKKIVNIMTKSSYEALIKSGVKIYEFEPGFIHAKTFVADDEVGIVSTINLDYRSLVHHFENGVWMYKTPVISEMKEDFDNTLFKSKFIDEQSARLKWYQRIIASIIMIFAPLM